MIKILIEIKMKIFATFLKHWRTSSAGIGVIGTGIKMIIEGQTMPGIAAIGTGIGLLFTHDANSK